MGEQGTEEGELEDGLLLCIVVVFALTGFFVDFAVEIDGKVVLGEGKGRGAGGSGNTGWFGAEVLVQACQSYVGCS